MKYMSFQEAGVVRLGMYDAGLELELEDVLVDGKRSRFILTVSPVSTVAIDGKTSDTVAMEADDGEVLELEMTDNSLFLIIEWDDYSYRKSFTKSFLSRVGR